MDTDMDEMKFNLGGSGTLWISRLEYSSVRSDGKLPSGGFIEVDGVFRISAPEGGIGADGVMREPAHWAVCLFPCDEHGNVFGWFISFDSRATLCEALRDGISASGPMSLQ